MDRLLQSGDGLLRKLALEQRAGDDGEVLAAQPSALSRS